MSSAVVYPPAILLIGSTGHGKSTLGNFLLNPEKEHITQNQTFPIARSNKPETQFVKIGVLEDRNGNPLLQVIDTPGLNEGAEDDLSHMIQIVKILQYVQSVSAGILCVKFDSKIDTQFKATIGYYRDFLPELFEANILIVMTNFAEDDDAVEMRASGKESMSLQLSKTLYAKLLGHSVDAIPSSTVLKCSR